jgi:hypothetical protein
MAVLICERNSRYKYTFLLVFKFVLTIEDGLVYVL